MPTTQNKPSLIRTLLILGRVSNLPTVWSNCLAGWLLSGGGEWARFASLCAGASLLYIGGMFLNDACDVRFDAQHRAGRPIPSGAISARNVWLLSFILFASGVALLASLGKFTGLLALGLFVCIVAYDLIHKRTALAPLLMAGCRFLLYLVAASATANVITGKTFWCAGTLAAYIVGLSYIARKETERSQINGLVVPLLVAPVLSGCMFATTSNAVVAVLLAGLFLVWLIWSMRQVVTNKDGAVGRAVSGLLAGIVLVDMLAVQGGGGVMPLVFVLLFVSALILQRKIPAT